MLDPTVSGGVVGSRDENDLLISAHHRLNLAVERRARGSDQHQSIFAFDRLQSLRQLLLQSLRVRLRHSDNKWWSK